LRCVDEHEQNMHIIAPLAPTDMPYDTYKSQVLSSIQQAKDRSCPPNSSSA